MVAIYAQKPQKQDNWQHCFGLLLLIGTIKGLAHFPT